MMMNLMITLMMMIFLSMMISHPLSLGMSLLMQTILISLTMGFFNYNYWFSYLMFLIMIGGMLVIFMYMTSIASNEKFNFSMKMMNLIIIIITMLLISNIMFDQYLTIMNNLYFESWFNTPMNYKMSLNKFINWPSNMIMMLMIIYLLITLIAIVKITNIKKGPLRQMN